MYPCVAVSAYPSLASVTTCAKPLAFTSVRKYPCEASLGRLRPDSATDSVSNYP